MTPKYHQEHLCLDLNGIWASFMCLLHMPLIVFTFVLTFNKTSCVVRKYNLVPQEIKQVDCFGHNETHLVTQKGKDI